MNETRPAPVPRDTPGAMRRYDTRLTARGPEGMLRRFLLTPAGTFLTNTPVFLLPGRLNIQPKHRLLDLQGGRASIARILAARVPFHTPPVAIDPSHAAITIARRDLGATPVVDLAVARPTWLPFADETFDLVIAPHLFRRLSDDALLRCMAEVHRVLRPAGVLAAWDFTSLGSVTLNRLHRRLLARDTVPPRLRAFSTLAYFADISGFDLIERAQLRPFLFPPIPHTAVLAQKGPAPVR